MTPHISDNVTLVGMDVESFRKCRESLIRDYAADNVRAGVWSKDEAEDKPANDVDGLLRKDQPPPTTTSTRLKKET